MLFLRIERLSWIIKLKVEAKFGDHGGNDVTKKDFSGVVWELFVCFIEL